MYTSQVTKIVFAQTYMSSNNPHHLSDSCTSLISLFSIYIYIYIYIFYENIV